MKDAIIVDIDGTAAIGIGEHRQAYDYSLVGNDKPNEAVFINIFSFWSLHPDGIVFFFSGRENVTFPGKSKRKDKCYRVGKFQGREYPDCKTLTKAWLGHYLLEFQAILNEEESARNGNICVSLPKDCRLSMRDAGDYRKDDEVKYDMYKTYIEDEYFIHYVLDDRQQVVDMWRDKCNLTCFQVAPGNF